MRSKADVDVVNIFFTRSNFKWGLNSQQQQEASRHAYDATTNNKYSDLSINNPFKNHTFIIFLLLRVYVKSIFANLECQNLQFKQFQQLWIQVLLNFGFFLSQLKTLKRAIFESKLAKLGTLIILRAYLGLEHCMNWGMEAGVPIAYKAKKKPGDQGLDARQSHAPHLWWWWWKEERLCFLHKCTRARHTVSQI